jgi:hypothetical protein
VNHIERGNGCIIWLAKIWRFGKCIIEGGPLHGFGEWVCCIFLLSCKRGVRDWLLKEGCISVYDWKACYSCRPCSLYQPGVCIIGGHRIIVPKCRNTQNIIHSE